MERVIDPRGNTNVSVLYDKYGRRVEQRDALNRLTKTEYAVPSKRQIKNTDAENHVWIETYDRKHRMLSRKDPLGNETKTTYDEAGNLASITEPLGYFTQMAHDQRANITNIIDALGNVSRRVIHPFFNKGVQEIDPLGWTNFIVIDNNTGNLLRNYDALGNLATYTYTTNGLAETSTDGNGHVTRFTHNTNGFLIAQTDAASNTTWFAVNELGWKLAQTNALGEVTTFSYDLNGKVTKTVDALSRTILQTYDANGNVLSTSDANGQFTYYAYDAANQRTQMVDRAGNVWRYDYDGIQNITNITDALDGHYVMAYGLRNERILERNQDGFECLYEYDQLLRLKRRTDPNGTTRTLQYDAGGRLLEARFNTGRVNTFDYDENDNPVLLSRSTVNPAAITRTRLDYDALDRVTVTTDAFGNKVKFGYDARGARTNLIYPDGKMLTYGCDAIGRLTNQVDWAARQMTYAYDNAGRLIRRTYPNGVVQTNVFDESGQLTGLSYSSLNPQPSTINIALQYAYDRNGNKIGSTETGTMRPSLPALTDERADFTAAGRLNTPIRPTVASSVRPTLNPQPSTLNSQPFLFVGSQGVMEELPGLYFMRARYYSAEAAVFLSTDPVKNIGPGWMAQAYVYVDCNPLSDIDPMGTESEPPTYAQIGENLRERLFQPSIAGKTGADTAWGLGKNYATYWNEIMHGTSGLDATAATGVFGLKGMFGSLSLIGKVAPNPISTALGTLGPLSGAAVDLWNRATYNAGTALAKSGFWESFGSWKGPRDPLPPFNDPGYIQSGLDAVKSSMAQGSQSAATKVAGKTSLPSNTVGKAVDAARHANLFNTVQGTVGKLATQAISMAAPFIGSFAADAFGRVLPKSTPPILREAAKFAVNMAVTSIVQAAAPYMGAVVGTAVAVTTAVAAGAAKVAVAVVVAIFGVPKQLTFLLAVICIAAPVQYWRHRRQRRLRDPAFMEATP